MGIVQSFMNKPDTRNAASILTTVVCNNAYMLFSQQPVNKSRGLSEALIGGHAHVALMFVIVLYTLIRLGHLQCESFLFRSPRLSVCLSRIRS